MIMYQRERMDTNKVSKDKLKSGQANPIVWKERQAKGIVWIPHIHHDFCLGFWNGFKLCTLHFKWQDTGVYHTFVPFSATHRCFLARLQNFTSIRSSDNTRDSKLTADNSRMAGFAALFCYNGSSLTHDWLPIWIGNAGDQNFTFFKRLHVLWAFNHTDFSCPNFLPHGDPLQQLFARFVELVVFNIGMIASRLDRLWPSLHNIELAGLSVFGPFNILWFFIVFFNNAAPLCKLHNVLVGNRKLISFPLRHFFLLGTFALSIGESYFL